MKYIKDISKLRENKILFYFCIIFIFAFLIRIYHLSSNPAGFFADEAAMGYNAYTLIHYGTDEYGTTLPLYFKSFGEYKDPIQIYSTIPFVLLFGLNEFSVRLTSVFFGMLCVIAIFYLTKELFSEEKAKYTIALLSSLFFSISPWGIHLSRIGFQAMPFVLFTAVGCLFFLRGMKKKWYFILSGISFGLAIYSYFPARIFIPLFTCSLAIIFHKKIKQNLFNVLIAIFITFILLIPFICHSLFSGGMSRWDMVSIFNNPPSNQSITLHILKNYLSHFSFNFLFLKGDIDMPGQFISRHSVRGFGELLLIQLPFILAGLIFLYKQKKLVILSILMAWFLLYPIGSSLTIDESAQATRSIIGILPFSILSACGTYVLSQKLQNIRYLFWLIFLGLLSMNVWIYTKSFYTNYPLYSSDFWGWQYGARDIVHFFVVNKNDYDQLVMAPEFNAPHIFFNFYAPDGGCEKCIIGLPETHLDSNFKQLFAVTPSYIQSHPEYSIVTKKQIIYPNNSPAFLIGEIKRAK